MSQLVNHAEAICRANSARLTPTRQRVLELVNAADKPIGAYDLLDQLKQEQNNAQPPTIYRALGFLLKHKLIHQLKSIKAYYSCECPGDSHTVLFLICERCQSATELIDPNLVKRIKKHIQSTGYQVDYPVVEVTGRCRECSIRPEGA